MVRGFGGILSMLIVATVTVAIADAMLWARGLGYGELDAAFKQGMDVANIMRVKMHGLFKMRRRELWRIDKYLVICFIAIFLFVMYLKSFVW